MSHSSTTNNLASSSPHLLKQLTSGIMTVSNPRDSEDAIPPCKKLKLDMEAVANCHTNHDVKPTRLRLLEKRRQRRTRLMESYKDNMSELFFLQSKGNVVDLPAFRKRPSQQYLNFLKSNNAPSDIMDQVRLAVLGPNALEKPNVTVSSGKVTVSSAAMAAAVVAAHGSNWRPITSNSAGDNSTVTTSKPPYSPRSSLLSPVKFGDQLQPKPSSNLTEKANSSYASYRLPSYTKDNLLEKLRQEAWVTRRINDLAREGLWSEKRLPKVCERPRPRTHWDSVLSEMQWLSLDFEEERQWKLEAAKMLAYSAKKYVEEQSERKAKKAAMLEKRHRCIAKFLAEQVEGFWQNLNIIHTEKISSTGGNPSSDFQGEASSESGVCNLDEDSDDSQADFLNDSSDFYYEEDDESTIEEQENYELNQNEKEDLALLSLDNEKAIEEVLASHYPGYSDLSLNDIDQHDSSISSDEFDSDLDDYYPSIDQVLVKLPLSGSQRKLYDDYLSSSQSELDSLDAQSIASVLQTLRKICNHPQLLETEEDEEKVPETLNFARVIDGVKIPSKVAHATRYDPLKQIDLNSLNLVFFTHESSLTAITSDRIRKCCAPKALIEELPTNNAVHPPRIPLYHFNYVSDGNSSFDQKILNVARKEAANPEAFHPNSLNVIAKFNERRCNGMPLYGQDLIEALTIDDSPPAKTTKFKSSYIKPKPDLDSLPANLACHFWPFLGGQPELKKSSHQKKKLRSRWLKNVTCLRDLSSVGLTIHSDLVMPPKVNLVAGFNRTHLALTSKHLAIEEAVKFARSKSASVQIRRREALFEISADNIKLRSLSSKLDKLDSLLREFRQNGERALIFCEMPEMLDLLGRFLHSHQVAFTYLDHQQNVKERLNSLQKFTSRNNFLALLASPKYIANSNLNSACSNYADICNVVFFDSGNDNLDHAETLEWCRSFNGVTNLRVYKLVAEDTVEDSLSIKALQQKLVMNNSVSNGPICKIKNKALEAIFNTHIKGDNGVLTDKNVGEKALEEILADPEVIAQLDWLWSNKINNETSIVELSRQVDKGCVEDELKPIQKYAREMLLPSLALEPYEDEGEDLEAAKYDWEEAYQKELALLASELDDLERMEPQLTYSRDDASRSWHGLDGQPMPLFTLPIPNSADKLRVEEHLSFLYQINLMEEIDLPPVYVKKEAFKRSSEAANDLDKHKMMRKEDGYNNSQGGAFAPRSLFDRHPAFQKQKIKAQQKRIPLGSGSYVHGPLPPNFQQQTGLPRHPIPRQQVEAENQPEWLIQEDWALLHTIKETQGLPLSLNTMSPAHTVNWDLVSDMVNAVSRVYRGPRQCKHRFETIIAPREEGRILYDPMPPSSLSSSSASENNKKNKKNKLSALKLPGNAPGKVNKPMKTSQIFNLDKNNSWASLFATRFETIKAVANKRSPTTKPLVVNPAQKNTKHAAVLAECGIAYESPLNPIQVAANRAERIQKEKAKTAQDQALNHQRVQAAQAAANAAQQSAAATAAATARVAIVQQQQQPNQAVVVGIPASSAGQQVRQVISQQSVQELVRNQQGSNQPTVVVTSQPPVVSVGSLSASQLAQTLKQAKPVSASPVTSAGINTSRLTQQQINILKQQALLKKNATEKARLQGIPTVSAAATAVVAAATSAGQKVSIAVTPSGVTLATLANSMPVTVVTQALGGGQQKTQLIRGVPGAKGLRMTEADMKQLLLANKQQLAAQKGATSGQSVTQLLQGIQSGAQQVTTLVKSQSAGGSPSTQSVTIPVQMQNVQGIKTLRQNQQPTMVQLRHQLVQSGPRSKIIPQGGQTILATTNAQGQKVALSQVAASGAKGVPVQQLIVSSGGNNQKPVTVQQIHQIKSGQPGQQQLIPHNLLKAGGQGSTVQARVIPATVAGRPQQIHVVAAPATVSNSGTRAGSAAPNVTVDASGRLSTATTTALGSQIRVAGSHQILNQVLNVRPVVTSVITAPSSGTGTTKLQVVHAPAQTGQNNSDSNQQQNG